MTGMKAVAAKVQHWHVCLHGCLLLVWSLKNGILASIKDGAREGKQVEESKAEAS